MESQTQRRKKFGRNEKTPPHVLTSRDFAIMRDVAEYRFLNTEQLLALHEGSRRNLTERISRLYHGRYLDRPEVQKKARLTSSHLFYSLDRRGAEVLAEDPKEREAILRRVREIKKSLSLIAHAAMISQFRVCLTLALKQHPDVQLTKWLQGNDLKLALTVRGKSPEIVPDAFFVLKDNHAEFPSLPFFLEADRGTEGSARFVSKLRIYWRWWKDGRCKDAFGFENFRVLTVAPDKTRSELLRRESKEADDKKKGSLMFLFAPETLWNIAHPDELLKATWKSPKDDTPLSILE